MAIQWVGGSDKRSVWGTHIPYIFCINWGVSWNYLEFPNPSNRLGRYQWSIKSWLLGEWHYMDMGEREVPSPGIERPPTHIPFGKRLQNYWKIHHAFFMGKLKLWVGKLDIWGEYRAGILDVQCPSFSGERKKYVTSLGFIWFLICTLLQKAIRLYDIAQKSQTRCVLIQSNCTAFVQLCCISDIVMFLVDLQNLHVKSPLWFSSP